MDKVLSDKAFESKLVKQLQERVRETESAKFYQDIQIMNNTSKIIRLTDQLSECRERLAAMDFLIVQGIITPAQINAAERIIKTQKSTE